MAEAQFNLASMYHDGLGTPHNPEKAKEYFEMCKHEHPLASYNLAAMTYQTVSVET